MNDQADTAPTPGGWREFRQLLAEFWREMRSPPQPLPVLYLRCDGCGQVTPHTSVQKWYSLTERGIAGGTPESVCDGCHHPQPRVVDDQVPADTPIVCTGRRSRRLGSKPSRHPCARTFTAPAPATLALCPWCVTLQPGPSHPDSGQDHP